jgi:hypothetical protein
MASFYPSEYQAQEIPFSLSLSPIVGRVWLGRRKLGSVIVAGCGVLIPSSHDFASIQTDTDRELLLQDGIVTHAVAQCECSGKGPPGIIPVRLREAEYRHDRIADELLDCAAMMDDDIFCDGIEPRQQGSGIFWVEGFTQRRGPADVSKKDCDKTTFFTQGRTRRNDVRFQVRFAGEGSLAIGRVGSAYLLKMVIARSNASSHAVVRECAWPRPARWRLGTSFRTVRLVADKGVPHQKGLADVRG